jgi:hypothetical protein
MPEVTPDPFGKLRQPAHVADGGAFEFGLSAGWQFAGHSAFQGGIQTRSGIEFGTVESQVDGLDLLLALR